MSAWQEISARVGRNDLPYYAITRFYEMDIANQREALADAWTMAEWPTKVTDEYEDALYVWETHFGLVVEQDELLTDDGKVIKNEFADSVTLYRGALEKYKAGLAWTTDIAVAKWFATRLGGDLKVWTITVPKELLLAKFDGRSESEIIVAVSMLLEDDVQEYQLEECS